MSTATILTASGGSLRLTKAFLIRDSVCGKLADGSDYIFDTQEGDTVTFVAEAQEQS